SSVSILRIELRTCRFPENLPVEVQARGALMSEVDEESSRVEDGRGTRVAVSGMNRWSGRTRLVKDLLLPDPGARLRVEAAGGEGEVLAPLDRHRAREIDPALPDHGRRPTESGDRLIPGHVLRRAPLHGEPGLGRRALGRRSAEFGPVLG